MRPARTSRPPASELRRYITTVSIPARMSSLSSQTASTELPQRRRRLGPRPRRLTAGTAGWPSPRWTRRWCSAGSTHPSCRGRTARTPHGHGRAAYGKPSAGRPSRPAPIRARFTRPADRQGIGGHGQGEDDREWPRLPRTAETAGGARLAPPGSPVDEARGIHPRNAAWRSRPSSISAEWRDRMTPESPDCDGTHDGARVRAGTRSDTVAARGIRRRMLRRATGRVNSPCRGGEGRSEAGEARGTRGRPG